MELSVIIVNWNSANYLRACLLSLYRETRGITFEVIVVNNDSHDDCKRILQEFPTVNLIEAGENLGFARANNLGYSRSNGEVLLFLNPDTEIIGDELARMAAHLRSHSTVGAVGARLLNSDGSLQTSCVQAFPTVWNQLLDFEFLRRLFPTWRVWGMRALFDGQPPDADAVSGACLMVKRSVFEVAGRFDEEYFMYADDLELCYKIRQAGYTVHCANDCQVIHHGGKSSAQQADSFSGVLQRESFALFFRKTRGAWYCGAYRVAMTAIALIRLSTVICFFLFAGARPLQGKAPRSVFRKWSRILGWALGFKKWPRGAGSPTGS
jgi:hypothetical protein